MIKTTKTNDIVLDFNFYLTPLKCATHVVILT